MRSDLSSDLHEARPIAVGILSDEMPRRFAHVCGVATRSEVALARSWPEDVELLRAAGFLHDIGYATALQETGFHPIDGARYLRSIDYDPRVVNLVAHHSCARIEARLRGLDKILMQEFPVDSSLPHDQLCFCDLTTSPDGELVTVEQRLAEIKNRYAPDSIVRQFVDEAEQLLVGTVRQVLARMKADGIVDV